MTSTREGLNSMRPADGLRQWEGLVLPARLRGLTEPQLLYLQERCFYYRSRSWTYQEAARQAGLDLAEECGVEVRVCAIDAEQLLAPVYAAVQERLVGDATRVRIEHATQLETIMMRGMQEFERSCQDLEIETVITGRAGVSQGEVVDLPDQVTRTTRTQSGSPALLAAVLQAAGDIRRIFGYDAAKLLQEHAERGAKSTLELKLEEVRVRLQPALEVGDAELVGADDD